MNLNLMNEPAALVFLAALHTESINSLPSWWFTLPEDDHNYSWSLKTTSVTIVIEYSVTEYAKSKTGIEEKKLN